MKKSTDELMKILNSKKSYSEFLQDEKVEFVETSISEYLNELLEEKQLKKSEVIRRGNLDKNYAYQIFNGNKLNPSRNKVLMISIGMGLTLTETRRLLKICNQSDLYIRNARDSVIIFGIDKKMTLMEINELLNDFSFEILE
jgi:transcriptional regulator with XRE-family HTH domain